MYEVFISTKVCDMMIINDLFQFWRLCTNEPLKEKRLLQDLILKKPLFPDIRNNNMSNTCSLCNSTYVWPADLKRHLKNQPRSTKVYT